MTYFELLKLLLPYGVYSDLSESEYLKDLSVHADALQLCQDNAEALLKECFADMTDQLLPSWERGYGISSDTDIPYPARIDNLLATINARGSLTRDYFTGLAARLGYTITIEEFVPLMAGWAEAGDELLIEDIVYIWQVNVEAKYYTADGSAIADGSIVAGGNSTVEPYFFEAGISCAGDSLCYFSDSFFESIFTRLKPAHTACVFVYQ